jgi:hypothetical protein
MKLTRTTALIVLVFLAVAAPVAAFALADDDNPGTSHHATHPGKAEHDDKSGDKSAKPGHATGEDRADEASGPGRAHAEAMKAWAKCVAEAASGPKSGEHSGPPKDACDDKPMGPGRARHLADHTGPFAPGHGQEKQKQRGSESD